MIDFSQLPRFKEDQFRLIGLIPEWAAAYEVDTAAIERQVYIAHAWANANRKKAPRKDPIRFLFNWMRQAKEYGNLRIPAPVVKRPPDPEPDLSLEEMKEIRKRNFGELHRSHPGPQH